MTNADTTKQTEEREPSKAPLIVGSVVTVGILGFIGWGIWQSLNPAPVPLQGMLDANTISVAAKIPDLPQRRRYGQARGPRCRNWHS